ncbi:MAG: DUF499 domain-containing protein, partial [Desulfurococcaceae archaeon]
LELFSKRLEVLDQPQLLDLDPAEYVLVVLLQPLPEVKEGVYTEGVLYDLIYYKKSGSGKSPRRYANSVAVLLSNRDDEWREVLKTAKRVIACEQLMKTVKVDPKVSKYIRDELNSIKEEAEKNLRRGLVTSYFNLIAYPDTDKDKGINVVRVSGITNYSGRTLAELAERALIEVLKAPERKYLEFESIVYYYSGGRDQKWKQRMSVQDVINAFLENPALPMIPADYIKEAIRDGLSKGLIGIEREGKVYFKPVYNDHPEGLLKEVRDTDVVLPQEEAAEKQIEELSNSVKEEVVDDTLVKQFYVIVRDGREIPVHELKRTFPENYISVFINSELKRREVREKRGFDLIIEPRDLEFSVSELPEHVTAKVFVKRVGDFVDEVVIEAEKGKVEPSKGSPDFEAEWVIEPPRKPGEYTFTIRATAPSRGLQREASLKLVVKQGLLCRDKPGEKLLELHVSGEVEPEPILDLLKEVNRSVNGTKLVKRALLVVEPLDKRAQGLKRRTIVQFEEATLKDVETVVKALRGALGVLASMKFAGLELVVQGEGTVENPTELARAHEEVKRRGARVEYCW